MEMKTTTFKENARTAIADETLQIELDRLSFGFPEKRQNAVDRMPEFEQLRDQARDIKNHVLANLDSYLESYETRVKEHGGQVHWCRDAKAAREQILKICKAADAKTVTKSKSMIGEEIFINDFLAKNGIEPIETDLGEYIIQLRGEPPSHIIAPAIHVSKAQVEEAFRRVHTDLPADRNLEDPAALLQEARGQLRNKFLQADVGLTGANMLVAETGSNVLVTNEGNADLTYALPRVHIVIASIEKIVPTLEDASTILRVLARSATGQDMSVYTTFCTGPKRLEDPDGPEEYHVILLDNGRTDLLGSEFEEILRCIRCSACLNHCPVYKAIGGHAYGWVYPGPMGAVLTPGLIGMEDASDLPNASTLCGKCESVCPMGIPLPKLLRSWRTRHFEAKPTRSLGQITLKSWAWLAKRPKLYHKVNGLIIATLGALGRRKGRIKWIPFASGWTSKRDFPAPMGDTFIQQYHKGARGDASGRWLREVKNE